MGVTAQRIEHTPLAGSGLSTPDDIKQREFAIWVEAKRVRNTQVTDWMRRDSDPFELQDIEIGQSYAPQITTTLGAQAGASDENLTVATTALLSVGDQLDIKHLYGDSTTEYNDSEATRNTITAIIDGTTITVQREEGETSDGSYQVHPSGSVVTVVSRAESYNTPFQDAITFRGDKIVQHKQRFVSGEITYDRAAVRAPSFEAPNGTWATDVMYWKNELPLFREDAFINGRLVTGNELSTPKIPYRMGGMIWFAEQVATNVEAIDGQLNIFDFSDIFEALETDHPDGPGDTIWMAPRLVSIWSEMLLPYKGMFGPGETTLDVRTTSVRTEFGTIKPRWANKWPKSKVLLTSKADWYWSHGLDMDWQYVERGPEELGAFQRAWTMGGDFSLVCTNITHQRLMTGIDTRKDLYPARSNFL